LGRLGGDILAKRLGIGHRSSVKRPINQRGLRLGCSDNVGCCLQEGRQCQPQMTVDLCSEGSLGGLSQSPLRFEVTEADSSTMMSLFN
jgi:hypothetical protein